MPPRVKILVPEYKKITYKITVIWATNISYIVAKKTFSHMYASDIKHKRNIAASNSTRYVHRTKNNKITAIKK